MRTAVYPGGFDPFTNGHLDLVTRMSLLFDRVVVGVVRSRGRDTMFTPEERVGLVAGAVTHLPSVEVCSFEGLTVEFARRMDAVALVRGIRAMTDYEVEFDMALMNRKMAPEIESVYLMTNREYIHISASRVRELSRLGYDVGDMVPGNVRAAVREKLGMEP
jgi:pantetheine-phosphate adenylyltransferase